MQNKDSKLSTKCRFCDIEMEPHIQHRCAAMLRDREAEIKKAQEKNTDKGEQ